MAVVADAGFFPISDISSYQAKWCIRARVTAKGNVRNFTSRNGAAVTVFECTLLDESGEIKASFFGQMAEKFSSVIEQGKVFKFSRGSCRVANRQYNRTNHRYEIVFDRDGAIEAVADDGKIDTIRFNFVDLRSLQSKALPCSVDLCGIIVAAKPTLEFTSKEGKDLVKREITLADDTENSIMVAIWGDRAKQEDKVFEGQPLVCLKGVTVKEFKGGRTASLEQAGSIIFDSQLPDAQRVRSWWQTSGSQANLTSISLSQEGVVELETVRSKPLPVTVDLCGVIVSFKPAFSFTSQAGKALVKREVTLADQSGVSILVTLWGDRAQQDEKLFADGAPVLLRGVLIKEWNGGMSGSLLEAGSLVFSPSTPEAERVRAWWSQGGATQSLTALSQEVGGGGARVASGRACTVSEMRRAADLVSTQAELFSVVARLAVVQTRKQGEVQPLLYMACQEPRPGSTLLCNKRVGEDGFCPACGRVGKAAPRLNIRCRFADFTDGAWLTTFHEAAQSVLGTTAEEAKAMEAGEGGRDALEAAIRRRYFLQPLQVTVRAKLDSYQGEPRTNITCTDARPAPLAQHGRAMLRNIHEMLAKRAEAGA